MTDISLPSIYPKGAMSKSLIGLEQLLFGRNFGCSTEEIQVSFSGSVCNIVLDYKQTISGLYFVSVEDIDGGSLRCLISANAKQSAFEGSIEYQNTVQLLSLTTVNNMSLEYLDVKASSTTDVGLLMSIAGTGFESYPVKVKVTQVGSSSKVRPSSSFADYTIDIKTTVTGILSTKKVIDDSEGVNVNLSDVNENSIILCNPASQSSRPNKSGIGMCTTFIADAFKVQLFWSEDGKMYLRSGNSSWVGVDSNSTYPKVVYSGIFFVSSDGVNETIIPVNDIDLRQLRYSITFTPQYDVVSLTDDIQVSSRAENGFGIKTVKPWAGVISYSITEIRAAETDPVFNLTCGRLDGQDFRPATSVEEGQTARFVLSTQNVTDGTSVPFTIQGVNESDVGIPLSGQFVVRNSSAYIDISVLRDAIADGDKNLSLVLANGTSVTASLMLKDTSVAPIFELYFSKDAAGTQPITKLDNGFQFFVIVKGVEYDPSVEYHIDFEGSTFSEFVLGGLPSQIAVMFNNNNVFSYPINVNQPSVDEEVVNITTDQSNLNLYNLAKTVLGKISDPCNIRFVISSGVTVSASTVIQPAITVGDFPYGSTVTLVNNGNIYGRGGRGGYAPSSMSINQLDGENGGACIDGSPTVFLTVYNYGNIMSGGGGGGASGVCFINLNGYSATNYNPIMSGGGGAPYGETPPIMGAGVEFIGAGKNSQSLIEYTPSYALIRQWYSRDNVLYKMEGNVTTVDNKHPVGDATATLGAKYNDIIAIPSSAGNGGDLGKDGTDGIMDNVNTFYSVVVNAGKGGKAGRIILQNEFNVDIKNISGIVSGH
ncbi:hypothetical protein nACB2_127 [Acinetobacter phage nACB2]|nr:hypothetical protein nACB2_127 [Acinetobacter phage nACB2]